MAEPLSASINKRFFFVFGGAAALAASFSLLGQLSNTLVEASTSGGVALSFVAGLVMGAIVARSWPAAAICGAAGGFANAFAGIGVAMLVREVSVVVLAVGSIGGIVVGAVGGLVSFAIANRRGRR